MRVCACVCPIKPSFPPPLYPTSSPLFPPQDRPRIQSSTVLGYADRSRGALLPLGPSSALPCTVRLLAPHTALDGCGYGKCLCNYALYVCMLSVCVCVCICVGVFLSMWVCAYAVSVVRVSAPRTACDSSGNGSGTFLLS